MTDLPFVNFAFPISKAGTVPVGAVPRRMPDRLQDVFNVKDFGAVGTNFATGAGGVDDRAAIQATFDAAAENGGGIVFFPPGSYYVGSKIIPKGPSWAPGVGQQLIVKGSGMGSYIWTDQRDYVLYIGHGKTDGSLQIETPIRAIYDLNFKNIYGANANYTTVAVMTSTEPKTSTGYTDATPGPSGTEGHGGIYIGSAGQLECRNVNVTLGTGIGICQVAGTQHIYQRCNIFCGFDSGSSVSANFQYLRSICMWLRCGYYGQATLGSSGTGIIISDGPANIENIDLENVGNALDIGSRPLLQWDPETHLIQPVDYSARCQRSTFASCNIEKVTNVGYRLHSSVFDCSFLSCHAASGGLGLQQGKVGLLIEAGTGCLFQGCKYDADWIQYGADITGATACIFNNVAASSTTGTPWRLRSTWPMDQIGSPLFTPSPNGVGAPNNFQYCNTDGSQAMGSFPTFGGTNTNEVIWVSGAHIPVSTGAISNVGKAIAGFATTNASTSSSNTLHFLPADIAFLTGPIDSSHQWGVASTGGSTAISSPLSVVSFNSSTGDVVVGTGVTVPSGTVIAFWSTGGPYKVPVRWVPTTNPYGWWVIA